MHARTLAAAALALVVAGCGGSSEGSDRGPLGGGGSGGTGGSPGTGGSGGGGDGPCTALTFDGLPEAEYVLVHEKRPDYVNQPPADGTYVLSGARVFVEYNRDQFPEGPSGETTRGLIRIDGNRIEWLSIEEGEEDFASGTWSIQEVGGFAAGISCPRPGHHRGRGMVHVDDDEFWLQATFCLDGTCHPTFEIFTRVD